jgi:hypothetical protein
MRVMTTVFLMNPSKSRKIAIAMLTVLTCWLAGCSGAGSTAPSTPSTAQAPVQVAGSVVSTAGSSNEMNVVMPAPIVASLTELGGSGFGVEWVSVAGDGTARTEPVDLAGDAGAAITGLTEKINADQATAPGRSALAGLAAITSPAGSPVWVFSPMLDTEGPLDFNQLAFDQSPPDVVTAVTAAGKLPNLQGRDVTFVVTPVAGAQQPLSQLQVGYQRAIWEGVATAAGASKVTFFDAPAPPRAAEPSRRSRFRTRTPRSTRSSRDRPGPARCRPPPSSSPTRRR